MCERPITVPALGLEAALLPLAAPGALPGLAAARPRHQALQAARPFATPWSPAPAATGTTAKGQNTAADAADNGPMEASCPPHWFGSRSRSPKSDRGRPNRNTATG